MNEVNEQQAVYQEFYDLVNMQPKELSEWLETDESQSVGDTQDGESTGHHSGRRIVEIQRKKKEDLTEADYDHMNKVNGYIKRHKAQGPSKNVEDSPWRYSLKNWGHDPLKD